VIPADLTRAAQTLIARPRVLIGLDFDGVLAPLVDQRELARPLPGAMAAVRRLAGSDGLEVALVSGRSLESLRAASGVSDEDDLSLIGSHGAESSLRHAFRGALASGPMTAATSELLDRVVGGLGDIAAGAGPDGGVEVEVKPTGAVLHTRLATASTGERASASAMAGPGSWAGVHATLGKSVVELAVVEASKGVALQALRAAADVTAVLYVGDDVTDESAFAVLGPDDVSVKVGPEETHAAYRLDRPQDVLELLQLLVAERSQR
jgi:trehalose 6-phosphate phosphatase